MARNEMRRLTDVLGEMTSAAARADNRGAEIAEVTGLSEATVRRRLKDAHGKTLVRNVFEGRWPSDNAGDEMDADALGEMTAAAARAGDREAQIANVTGLVEGLVRRRLEEAHGNTLVRNVFAERWPSGDEDDDRDRYERDYNVRVIPYVDHAEVPAFLEHLAATKNHPLS